MKTIFQLLFLFPYEVLLQIMVRATFGYQSTMLLKQCIELLNKFGCYFKAFNIIFFLFKWFLCPKITLDHIFQYRLGVKIKKYVKLRYNSTLSEPL